MSPCARWRRKLSVTPGATARKRERRGTSHLVVNVGTLAIVSRSPFSRALSSSIDALPISRSGPATRAWYTCPARVSTRLRPSRTNSFTPNSASRFAICRLTALGVRPSSRAAYEKFRYFAEQVKACSSETFGYRCFIATIPSAHRSMRALYVFFMTMPCRLRTLRPSRKRVTAPPGGRCAVSSSLVRECFHACVYRPGPGRWCSDFA